jgi:hypothetical protein
MSDATDLDDIPIEIAVRPTPRACDIGMRKKALIVEPTPPVTVWMRKAAETIAHP